MFSADHHFMYNSAWKKIQQLSWKSQGTTHFTKWAVIIGLDLENVWHRNASSNFKSSKFVWSWCPYRWPQHVLGFWCSRLSDAYGVDILGGRDSARSKSGVLITSGRDQSVRNRFRRWLIHTALTVLIHGCTRLKAVGIPLSCHSQLSPTPGSATAAWGKPHGS